MAPKKILAADDENDVLLIVKTSLNNEGYEVITATNGADALAKAKSDQPDLILLDVMMPELSGFEVLAKLKEDENTAHIPVVMLTALGDRERVKSGLESGADYYMVKPFVIQELLDKTRLILAEANEDPFQI